MNVNYIGPYRDTDTKYVDGESRPRASESKAYGSGSLQRSGRPQWIQDPGKQDRLRGPLKETQQGALKRNPYMDIVKTDMSGDLRDFGASLRGA